MFASKVAIILLYLAGVIATVSPVFGSAGPYIIWAALGFLAAHCLELVVAYKYLDRHPGGMAQSVMLCILFGVVHWLPLKKMAATH